MFGRRPRLPIDYDFPAMILDSTRVTRPGYVREVEACLREAYAIVDAMNRKEVTRQKRYYDRKCRAAVLEEDDVVLVRQDHREGRKKLTDRWNSKLHRIVRRMGEDSPVYEVEDCDTHRVRCLHRNKLLVVQLAKRNGEEEELGAQATEAGEDVLQREDGGLNPATHPEQTGAPMKDAEIAAPVVPDG
jgi:hypothetical protein